MKHFIALFFVASIALSSAFPAEEIARAIDETKENIVKKSKQPALIPTDADYEKNEQPDRAAKVERPIEEEKPAPQLNPTGEASNAYGEQLPFPAVHYPTPESDIFRELMLEKNRSEKY